MKKGYLILLSNIRIMVQNLLSHSKVLHTTNRKIYKNPQRISGCFDDDVLCAQSGLNEEFLEAAVFKELEVF